MSITTLTCDLQSISTTCSIWASNWPSNRLTTWIGETLVPMKTCHHQIKSCGHRKVVRVLTSAWWALCQQTCVSWHLLYWWVCSVRCTSCWLIRMSEWKLLPASSLSSASLSTNFKASGVSLSTKRMGLLLSGYTWRNLNVAKPPQHRWLLAPHTDTNVCEQHRVVFLSRLLGWVQSVELGRVMQFYLQSATECQNCGSDRGPEQPASLCYTAQSSKQQSNQNKREQWRPSTLGRAMPATNFTATKCRSCKRR